MTSCIVSSKYSLNKKAAFHHRREALSVMQTRLRLGALDICRIHDGMKATDAVWETIEIAPTLESFGYSRLWIAEHHAMGIGHSCPETMTALIAGCTDHIRVGPAGILLRYYHPIKVAATFRLMHTVFPGRIDLGLARGSVRPALTRYLTPAGASYESNVSELLSLLRGTEDMIANPAGVAPPEVWILGSGTESAKLAARHGTAFGFAVFLDTSRQDICSEVIDAYRTHFSPSRELSEPLWNLTIAGICAETDDEAQQILSTVDDTFKVVPTAIGSPATCLQYIKGLMGKCKCDEIVFMDLCPSYNNRVRSYRLLSDAIFGC